MGRHHFDIILLIKIKLTIQEAVQNYFDRDTIMIVAVNMVYIAVVLNDAPII